MKPNYGNKERDFHIQGGNRGFGGNYDRDDGYQNRGFQISRAGDHEYAQTPTLRTAPVEHRPSNTPFTKNFSANLKNTDKYTKKEIDEWRQKHKIAVGKENNKTAGNVPDPILSFDDACFSKSVLDEFHQAGFEQPTPIQAQGWAIALRGHDLIGIAKTGSGKTLAFVGPAFIHILAQKAPKRGEGPIALALAPTRELAVQIYEECLKFGASSNIRVTCVYGGVPKFPQKKALYSGVDILIATPGRLIDLIEEDATNLARVTYLVLDEADKMLDMGFEDQIREIIRGIRRDRQTLMWSATWPPEVRRLARELCIEDPIKIQVGSQDLAVNDMIKQEVMVMDEDDKRRKVELVLARFEKDDRVLVFCQTKKGCDWLNRYLERQKFHVNAIHGDKSQKERDRVLQDFRDGERPILIATDVAARGLDIKGVKCVINYDFPPQIEDYIHRVGRTGRAGAQGIAVSFFTEDNLRVARDLINVLKEAKQEIPKDLLGLMKSGRRNRSNSGPRPSHNYTGGAYHRPGNYDFDEDRRGGGGGRGGFEITRNVNAHANDIASATIKPRPPTAASPQYPPANSPLMPPTKSTFSGERPRPARLEEETMKKKAADIDEDEFSARPKFLSKPKEGMAIQTKSGFSKFKTDDGYVQSATIPGMKPHHH